MADTNPVRRRIPVPELPTSRRWPGSCRCPTPPSMYSSSPAGSNWPLDLAPLDLGPEGDDGFQGVPDVVAVG